VSGHRLCSYYSFFLCLDRSISQIKKLESKGTTLRQVCLRFLLAIFGQGYQESRSLEQSGVFVRSVLFVILRSDLAELRVVGRILLATLNSPLSYVLGFNCYML